MRLKLTRLGWALAVLAVLLYGASLSSQSSLLLMLVGVILVCGLANLLAARQSLHAVSLEPPPVAHVAEGQRLKHPWRILNGGPRGAGLLQIHSPLGTLGRLTWLAPAAAASLLPDFTYWKRGVFPNAAVTVTTFAPFGLVEVRRQFDLPGEVIVHPALYETPAPRAAGYDSMVGGRYKGRGLSASGAHFHGVRPIQPGDPLRQIHWKASAKGLGLMVKTFEEELSGRVAVLLDTSPSGDPKVLDDAVRAAGSLLFAALDEGHHVEWVELGRLQHLLIPPFADGGELLDALARVEPATAPLTAGRLEAAAARVSPRGALLVVLTGWSEVAAEVAATWRAAGRVVDLYVPAQTSVPNPCRIAVPVGRFSAASVEAPR